MAKDCPLHAGKSNEYFRIKLANVMTALPENQSGEGRHKCPYCAYAKGYQDGIAFVADKLRDYIIEEIGGSTN